MVIEVWICPKGHYYASSSIHGQDLREKLNHETTLYGGMSKPPTGNRSTCQHCKLPRALRRVEVAVPVAVAV